MRPRIRTLKPDIHQDEKVGKLSRDGSRLTWYGLITQADDAGRLYYLPRIIRLALFPWDDDVTDENLVDWIAEIEKLDMIFIYPANGNEAIQIVNWKKHQRINRPSPSEIPSPPNDSVKRHGGVSEDSVKDGMGRDKDKERIGGDTEGREADPPRVKECCELVQEIRGWKSKNDEKFFTNLLESVPFLVVKKTIEDLRVYQEAPKKQYKNLQSTLRNWCNQELERRKSGTANKTDGNEDGGKPQRRGAYRAPSLRD